MIDGNTAALRQYEQAQDRQDTAYSSLMEMLEDNLEQIAALIDECYAIAKDYDDEYDFTDDISYELEALL